ncbi:FAD-binding oxidoreductase [Saccharolobus islandicus]|uniref:FAD-binding oxidoreductase n=1 Tax=Saccharolobus islandicus TaxID=43080 RepID=UPI0003648927|nr:FAD-binding oxidoreductase [Sulfolobus islandicus]
MKEKLIDMESKEHEEDKLNKDLKSKIKGRVIFPNDLDYDQERKTWNGMVDKKPAIIVKCSGVQDVINAIEYAKNKGIKISIRSGGHGVSGSSIIENGLVIDLSLMKGIWVNPKDKTAIVQSGVTWGEFDREAQVFGLATPGGRVSTTGVAGFTLGGGIGWLSRKYGLACDNLLSAQIVTADGQVLDIDKENEKDLFWAIRGGGTGFGVVTSFQFKMHKVGPMVYGGLIIYPAKLLDNVIDLVKKYMERSPQEVFILTVLSTAPPLPFIPKEMQGSKVITLAGGFMGDPKEGEEILSPIKSIGEQKVDMMGPIPYTVLQSLPDALNPPHINNYWKNHYLKDLKAEPIEIIRKYYYNCPSPITEIHLEYLGGALSKVPDEENAFGHRNANWNINIVSKWKDPKETEINLNWTRRLSEELSPFSVGHYINYNGDSTEDIVKSSYNETKYKQLVKIKKNYDPNNVFVAKF